MEDLTVIAPAERWKVARERCGGFPWFGIAGGWVGGMITMLLPVGVEDPTQFGVVLALGLIVGAVVGHGGKYLHAYCVYAPKKILSERVASLQLANRALMGQVGRARWTTERKDFERQAKMLWTFFRNIYKDFASTQEGVDLGVVVEAADWPDRGGCDALADFARYAYPDDPSAPTVKTGQDMVRKNVVETLRVWSERLGGVVDEGGQFSDYLAELVAPAHMRTVKLLVFLEPALALQLGTNHEVDLGFLYTLRDSWESDGIEPRALND